MMMMMRMIVLMMDGKVSRLGVVVAPWSKVIISFAGAAVHLDLNTTHGLQIENSKLEMVTTLKTDIKITHVALAIHLNTTRETKILFNLNLFLASLSQMSVSDWSHYERVKIKE